MIEDNNIGPGEIDPEELRRHLADMGAPLTPNVVNRDNEWLEPIAGLIGHVSEVNGEDAEELHGLVPTRRELCVLVKYWMTKVIDYDFWLFCYHQTSSSGSRRSAFGSRRIDRIAAFLGEDGVKRAIDEAYEEFGRQHNSEAWRIFLHGTEEELRAFRAKQAAAEAARARENEDQFYASLLQFLAGEPHDIRQGTVGMTWAENARALVNENPALAAPENKDMLLEQMRDRYSRLTVVFTGSEVAAVRDQFYASLLQFLAGEPHDIKPGTVGMKWAEIAKALVVENPVLAAPEYKDTLLGLMHDRFSSAHTVHSDESDIAAAKALSDKQTDRRSADQRSM
jgi:hypothetical protein